MCKVTLILYLDFLVLVAITTVKAARKTVRTGHCKLAAMISRLPTEVIFGNV